VIVNQQKTSLKEKAISEAKKFAVIVGYLWVLFVLFEIHKITILRGQNPASPLGYRVGFALINALILGKIILIAEAFHFGEKFKDRPLVYAILFKAAAFSVLLVCFDILEDVIVGLFHQKTITESMPTPGGQGVEGILLVALMVFIVLIPFFAFREIARAIAEDELLSLLFKRRTSRRVLTFLRKPELFNSHMDYH
jgi:hypothetical protein